MSKLCRPLQHGHNYAQDCFLFSLTLATSCLALPAHLHESATVFTRIVSQLCKGQPVDPFDVWLTPFVAVW
jgi:hypothetical protein